ncbi:serine hydrolase domain-containing protein [Streptomyces sp. NPDC006984]|uniref:serine hydrolase domain-containing protein n=1 Tax=Streptomyces sp. NPDC006984 TaxID=3155463 RepID=UPI0033D99AF9
MCAYLISMRKILLSALCAAALLAGALPATAADHRPPPCTASPPARAGKAADVVRIAEEARRDLDLNSVVLKVTVRGREVVTSALGESMTGVPADPAMHFRNGSVAIAYLGTVLLQLVDEGRVSLDDPVSRWLPRLPHSERITLRMLGSSTSGLADYVTDPGFLAALDADPFRQWEARELVRISTSHPLWYRPGTNWSYSHANFVILGRALERITDRPLDALLRERILRPLGLSETRSSTTPDIPAPVLHAFTAERGTYEESTFWNPSWTTAPGAVMTTDICDLARSAVAVGTGELLSRRAHREQLDPGTVGLGGPTDTCPETVCSANTEARHYGLGVNVLNTWITQNPVFNGFAAVQAYLPSRHLAIAVSTTQGPDSPGGNTAQLVAARIAAFLAPERPLG